MKIKVYTKLTLSEREVRSIFPGAHVSAPVKRGDLIKDIEQAFHCIVIIDGKFHQSLAVSVSEIMDALRCGAAVYGASSMGALRAAELDVYGMTGYGKIYEMIKGETVFRDDYLGQIMVEAGSEVRGLSRPYVDVLCNLATLADRGEISRKTFRLLAAQYGELHYSQRNGPSFMRLLRGRHPRHEGLLRAAQKAAVGMGSQKKRDALGVLRKVRADMRRIARINAEMERT